MTTHTDTEKLRLDAGLENCGCPECQAFYKTIDLSKYGGRVKTFGDVVIISAKSPKPEKPVNELSTNPPGKEQVTKRHGVKTLTDRKTPTELCNKPVIDCSAPLCVDSPENEVKVLRKRGRPLKVGEVNRTTLWRRAKKFPPQKEMLPL